MPPKASAKRTTSQASLTSDNAPKRRRGRPSSASLPRASSDLVPAGDAEANGDQPASQASAAFSVASTPQASSFAALACDNDVFMEQAQADAADTASVSSEAIYQQHLAARDEYCDNEPTDIYDKSPEAAKLHPGAKISGILKVKSKMSVTTMVYALVSLLRTGEVIALTNKPEAIRCLERFLSSVAKCLFATIVKAKLAMTDIAEKKAFMAALTAAKLGNVKFPNFANLHAIHDFLLAHRETFANDETILFAGPELGYDQVYLVPVLKYSRADRDFIGRFYEPKADDDSLKAVISLKGCFRKALFCNYDLYTKKLTPFAVEIDMSACHQSILLSILQNSTARKPARDEESLDLNDDTALDNVDKASLAECQKAKSIYNLITALKEVVFDKKALREKISQYYQVSTKDVQRREIEETYGSLLDYFSQDKREDIIKEYMTEQGFGPDAKEKMVPLGVESAKQLLLLVMFGGSATKALKKEGATTDKAFKVHKTVRQLELGLKLTAPRYLRSTVDKHEPLAVYRKCKELADAREKAKGARGSASGTAGSATKDFHSKLKKLTAANASKAIALYLQTIEATIMYHIIAMLTSEKNVPVYLYLYDGVYVDIEKYELCKQTCMKDCASTVLAKVGLNVLFEEKKLDNPLRASKTCNGNIALLKTIDQLARIMYWIAFNSCAYNRDIVKECIKILRSYGLDPSNNKVFLPESRIIDCAGLARHSLYKMCLSNYDRQREIARRPLVEYICKFYGRGMPSQCVVFKWSSFDPRMLDGISYVPSKSVSVDNYIYPNEKKDKEYFDILEVHEHSRTICKNDSLMPNSFNTIEEADAEGDQQHPDLCNSLFWTRQNTHVMVKDKSIPQSFLQKLPYMLHYCNYGDQSKCEASTCSAAEQADQYDAKMFYVNMCQGLLIHDEYVKVHGVPLIRQSEKTNIPGFGLDDGFADFVRIIPFMFHLIILGDPDEMDRVTLIALRFMQLFAGRVRYPHAKFHKFLMTVATMQGIGKSLLGETFFGPHILGSADSQAVMRQSNKGYKNRVVVPKYFVSLQEKDMTSQFSGVRTGSRLESLDEMACSFDKKEMQQLFKRETTINTKDDHQKYANKELVLGRSFFIASAQSLSESFTREMRRRMYALINNPNHPAFKFSFEYDQEAGKTKYRAYMDSNGEVTQSRAKTITRLVLNHDWAFGFYRTLMDTDRKFTWPGFFNVDNTVENMSVKVKQQTVVLPYIETFGLKPAYLDKEHWNVDIAEQGLLTGHILFGKDVFKNIFHDKQQMAKHTGIGRVDETVFNDCVQRLFDVPEKCKQNLPGFDYSQYNGWTLKPDKHNVLVYTVLDFQKQPDFADKYNALLEFYIESLTADLPGRRQTFYDQLDAAYARKQKNFEEFSNLRNNAKTKLKQAIDAARAEEEQRMQRDSSGAEQGGDGGRGNDEMHAKDPLVDAAETFANHFWGPMGIVHRFARMRLFRDGKKRCRCMFKDSEASWYDETNPCFWARMKREFEKIDSSGKRLTMANLYPPSYHVYCEIFGQYKLAEYSQYLTQTYFDGHKLLVNNLNDKQLDDDDMMDSSEDEALQVELPAKADGVPAAQLDVDDPMDDGEDEQ